MVKLPRFQAAVLAKVFDSAPIHEEAVTLEFKLSDSADVFHVAYARLTDEAGYRDSYLVFSLASVANRVFMTVTAGRPREVARALANLEEYDRQTSLSGGSVIRVPDQFFGTHGLTAVLLLRPSTLNGFDDVEDSSEVQGRRLDFSLTLFLTEAELEFKRLHGHDALMSRFDAEGRDVRTFMSEQ